MNNGAGTADGVR